MQHDITKLCADSLRAYAKENLVDLKSSHAHEIVAAFFGYKSKIALLADRQYPIGNLRQADLIILPPENDVVNAVFKQRQKDLQFNAIDEYEVHRIVSDVLKQGPVYNQSLEEIAHIAARRQLVNRFKIWGIDPDQLNLIVEITDSSIGQSETSFTVSVDYISDQGIKTQRESTMIVTFSRVAGYVGYKEPSVFETTYSGEFRKIPVQDKFQPQWPYPAGTLVMTKEGKEIGIVWKSEVGAYGGSVTICTHKSLNASLAKEEVFPLSDQSTDFIPLRLFIPYGKWTCLDGSEVLYNRDYRPLWKKGLDGKIEPMDPASYVEHDRSKDEAYFNTNNTPVWGDINSMREVGLSILRAWGVEKKHPKILDLLPVAIKNRSADILRQKH